MILQYFFDYNISTCVLLHSFLDKVVHMIRPPPPLLSGGFVYVAAGIFSFSSLLDFYSIRESRDCGEDFRMVSCDFITPDSA